MLGHRVDAYLTLKETTQQFSKVTVPFSIQASNIWECQWLHSCQDLVLAVFHLGHAHGNVVASYCNLIHISLVTDEEPYFMCLLSYSFVLFFLFNWIVWVMIVLYIFWIQVLCQITGYKYFFLSCGFSVLSTLFSDEKEVLILMKPNLWTFVSWLTRFLFKKSLPTPKSWRCYLLLLFFFIAL